MGLLVLILSAEIACEGMILNEIGTRGVLNDACHCPQTLRAALAVRLVNVPVIKMHAVNILP